MWVLGSGLLAASLAVVQDSTVVQGSTVVQDSTLVHAGGSTPPQVTAARAGRAPVLDGYLDETVWQAAAPVTGFRRDRPGDGLPAAERTEVRVAYTETALYVGARMFDRDPTRISRLRGRRDSFMQPNDQFLVQIDSYHDHRSAFIFGVTPAGGRNDLIAPNDGFRGMDAGWDPVWDAATRIDSLGWVAEVRIPFSQLRFPGGEDAARAWGINFRRDILHAGEAVDWAWRPSTEAGLASTFGHLLGLEGLPRPGRLEVLPYALARGSFDQRASPSNPFDDGSVYGGSMGLDLKYGLTSGLTLDATVNPDFGQVEADPAVVNLTAFETFFEERRPFFVEGAGVFGFGGVESLRFFYSRRVGQRPALFARGAGQYVDQPTASRILGAAKLSGRTKSNWLVGFLTAMTRQEKARLTAGAGSPVLEAPVDPRSNTTALRIRKDLNAGESYVGAIATAVARNLSHEAFGGLRDRAVVGGTDFRHRFANRAYELQGWAGASYVRGSPEAMARAQRSSVRYYQRPDQEYAILDSTRTSLAGYGGELSIRKVSGEWLYGLEGSVISPGFEMNDAGFQTIADVYALVANVARRWVEPGRWFRSSRVGVNVAEMRNFGRSAFNRRISANASGQTHGFRSLRASVGYGFGVSDHRATRGGPAMASPASWNGSASVTGDARNRVSGTLSVAYSRDAEGSYSASAAPGVFGRGEGWFSWSVRPRLARSRSAAFYVAQAADPAALATYGRRYVFAQLEQSSIDVTARVDMALTPTMTLQLYAQPFAATGDYEAFGALTAPGTFDFLRYGSGPATISRSEGRYAVDADGPSGPAATVSFRDPDFRVRSFRSNVVLRWEYLPGSTLYLVWSQDRADAATDPSLGGPGDLARLFTDPMRNVLLVKASYWLNF